MADLEKADHALSPTATVTGDASPPTKKAGSVDEKGTLADMPIDESAFPTGAKLALLLLALLVNVFIVALDQVRSRVLPTKGWRGPDKSTDRTLFCPNWVAAC